MLKIIFGMFVWFGMLILIATIYNDILLLPFLEEREVEIHHVVYSGVRSPSKEGRSSPNGRGILIGDSVSVVLSLASLRRMGVKKEDVKLYLNEVNDILPVWTTSSGWGTRLRYEKKGERYDWFGRLLPPLVYVFLFCCPYLLLICIEKARNHLVK